MGPTASARFHSSGARQRWLKGSSVGDVIRPLADPLRAAERIDTTSRDHGAADQPIPCLEAAFDRQAVIGPSRDHERPEHDQRRNHEPRSVLFDTFGMSCLR
jgi:hypothetical protein